VFVAAYRADGSTLIDARAVPRESASEELEHIRATSSIVVVGEVAAELGLADVLRSNEADLPHAVLVARLGAGAPVPTEPVQPKYVRGPNATLPDLPPSPLATPLRG
jgi:hypothetical protein